MPSIFTTGPQVSTCWILTSSVHARCRPVRRADRPRACAGGSPQDSRRPCPAARHGPTALALRSGGRGGKPTRRFRLAAMPRAGPASRRMGRRGDRTGPPAPKRRPDRDTDRGRHSRRSRNGVFDGTNRYRPPSSWPGLSTACPGSPSNWLLLPDGSLNSLARYARWHMSVGSVAPGRVFARPRHCLIRDRRTPEDARNRVDPDRADWRASRFDHSAEGCERSEPRSSGIT
jgi:hypothetical protein